LGILFPIYGKITNVSNHQPVIYTCKESPHPCILHIYAFKHVFHWIGLRENLQENPIFHGKNNGFL
jgi:hypothetical protein